MENGTSRLGRAGSSDSDEPMTSPLRLTLVMRAQTLSVVIMLLAGGCTVAKESSSTPGAASTSAPAASMPTAAQTAPCGLSGTYDPAFGPGVHLAEPPSTRSWVRLTSVRPASGGDSQEAERRLVHTTVAQVLRGPRPASQFKVVRQAVGDVTAALRRGATVFAGVPRRGAALIVIATTSDVSVPGACSAQLASDLLRTYVHERASNDAAALLSDVFGGDWSIGEPARFRTFARQRNALWGSKF